MKGLKRVTYLPPYPPQKLTATNTDSGTVKITWARPKGEFEKYILKVTFFIYHYRIIIIIAVSGPTEHCPIFHFPSVRSSSVRPSQA